MPTLLREKKERKKKKEGIYGGWKHITTIQYNNPATTQPTGRTNERK
jgi:hypothetical protein